MFGVETWRAKHTSYHTEYLFMRSKATAPGELKWWPKKRKMTHPFAESAVDSRRSYSQMWLKVFAFAQRETFVNRMKRNWNQRSCYSLMPKKVCVMCFFLPQVHWHKAQAQFPSFNRAARICLFFFVSFFKNAPVQETSRVTTARGSSSLRRTFMTRALSFCVRSRTSRELLCFLFVLKIVFLVVGTVGGWCCSVTRKHGRIHAGETEHWQSINYPLNFKSVVSIRSFSEF